MYLTFCVPPSSDGSRLGSVLRYAFGVSSGLLKQCKYLPDGILLNGTAVHPDALAHGGDTIALHLPEDPPSHVTPTAHPLDIFFEDAHLLIVNKPPLVQVHPNSGHREDTLGNFVIAHYNEALEHHSFRPVNRLDRGTSGLMVVAKHAYAQDRMTAMLHSGGFRRRYLALCEGVLTPSEGTITAPIGRADGSVLLRTVRQDGKSAVTHYQTLSTDGTVSLLSLELETGRTHQIRVHLAWMGHPLLGDFLYGKEDQTLIKRAALHSAALSLTHPVTGEPLAFECVCPEDMAQIKRAHRL